MKPVNFGIDLGTTNSLIAKYEQGKVVIFKNPIGHKETLASVVAFRKDRTLVGDKAREYLLKDAVNVFGSFKRKMGTDERHYVVNLDENITPIELSAYVLRELKQFIHTGEPLEAAVITIPASFDSMQSNATKLAGEAAGIAQVFLLQEPIAAGLAYFNQQQAQQNGNWLVYDLGGGTFDIALVTIDEGEMKVIDHEGNNFLGGVDFDSMIVDELIIPTIIKATGIDDFDTQLKAPFGPYEALYFELLYKAEELKKELSFVPNSSIEFSATIGAQSHDFAINIATEEFNAIISKRVQETIVMIQQVMQRNQLAPADINKLILIGGSTYIPYVKQTLAAATQIPIGIEIDPTTAVAIGAAYYAANRNYEPKNNAATLNAVDDMIAELSLNETAYEMPHEHCSLVLSYSKTSKEIEEVLLVKVEGIFQNYTYRIIRKDGGFDTGFIPLKAKFTEFIPLLPQVVNPFTIKIFDQNNNELTNLSQEFSITHGQFNIAGQPLPKDICIEIDDPENNTTKLELIFEKNSVLPLRKTLYREISKTIKKGSSDKIIINIIEGDKFARPVSNLTIGCIEIGGKDLNSDLIKGSDIELLVQISDNRTLNTEAFLVMTQQSFKNVFTISEKHISVDRLKEQYNILETEIRNSVKYFTYESNEIWEIEANQLLSELLSHRNDVFKLKEKEHSDKKYIIAEAVSRISQAYDKIGGNDRLQSLQSEYLDAKEYVEQHLPSVDYERDKMQSKYQQLIRNEAQILLTRNPSILNKAIEQMNKLAWDVLYNMNSYLIVRYEQIKSLDNNDFKNHHAAQAIFKIADQALQQERFHEFRQHVYNLTHLLRYEKSSLNSTTDFKGTGIG
jgi:molecular chaperone DnaK